MTSLKDSTSNDCTIQSRIVITFSPPLHRLTKADLGNLYRTITLIFLHSHLGEAAPCLSNSLLDKSRYSIRGGLRRFSAR